LPASKTNPAFKPSAESWRPFEADDLFLICCHVRLHHFGRIDNAVELLLGYQAELQGSVLQCQIMIRRVVRDLRRLVVANDRRERRYEHQRAINVFLDLFEVRLGSLDQEPPEVRATVAQDSDGMDDVVDHLLETTKSESCSGEL